VPCGSHGATASTCPYRALAGSGSAGACCSLLAVFGAAVTAAVALTLTGWLFLLPWFEETYRGGAAPSQVRGCQRARPSRLVRQHRHSLPVEGGDQSDRPARPRPHQPDRGRPPASASPSRTPRASTPATSSATPAISPASATPGFVRDTLVVANGPAMPHVFDRCQVTLTHLRPAAYVGLFEVHS